MSIRSYKKDKGCFYRSRKSKQKKKKRKKKKEKFRSNLGETKRGKWKHKSEEQKSRINLLKMFYKARENIIKLFDNYTKIVSNTTYEGKHGKGFKILTPKQMFQ